MSGTLNDLIISAINGAEVDEREALADVSPIIEKTAAPKAVVDNEIEKIAAALEWYATTGVEAFVELDKKASSPNLSEIQRRIEGGSSLTQAVALTHPTLPSAHRAEIVETLSEKTAMSSYKKVQSHSGGDPAVTSSQVSGEQPDPRDPDTTHHPALSSNEAAINYSKSVKSKHYSGSLQRILDAKPYADPGLKQTLNAAKKPGLDPNIHSKTASEKSQALAQIKAAIASKLAQQIQE